MLRQQFDEANKILQEIECTNNKILDLEKIKASNYKKRLSDGNTGYNLSAEDAITFISGLIEKENKQIKELEEKFALL